MTAKTDLTAARVSRRTFLKTSAGAALVAGTAGSLALPQRAKAATGLVALVHTQAAGDNGPIDSMIAALKKLSDEQGFPIRTIYAQDSATFPTIFETLADAGAEVIVGTFNEVAEPIKELAPKFPDTKFIQIFGDAFEPVMPNVVTVSYDYYLGCYLSGLFAAKVSKTGKIGYIGGVSLPPLNADLNAMKAAAASVGADKSVTGAFAGSFQDPAKGHEIANQMYQDGIDYIQTDAAATDTGIIQAANEVDGRMVSAGSTAQFKLGAKSVIAVVSLDFGQSLYNEVSKAIGPDFKAGHLSTGIGTGVIDFVLSPDFETAGPADLVARAKEVWPEIEKARAGIIDGTLEVPFNTEL
ncbi:BMP family ABC transporter substrate-binding protein [Bauldia litoralis]|uniref:BMP family ABC transporter substrate-binding protein n=1 Tax=Bauldia litoralis TaxID=665467 RepID=UPI0032654354